MQEGDRVYHHDFGVGVITFVFGAVVSVDFGGDTQNVEVAELRALTAAQARAPMRPHVAFRRTLESMVMGVVPSSASQLLAQTIDATSWKTRISGWLERADSDGACKILAGYYGAGKTHHLQLVRAIAKQQGWVTATLEFDPKSADPAKPHLVYEGLMRGLEFPARPDGTVTKGWLGFVDEVRHKWKDVETSAYFKRSGWFRPALDILRRHHHDTNDQEYVDAAQWLAGNYGALPKLRAIHKKLGVFSRFSVRALPRSGDTSAVYAVQLATLAQMVRKCGYAGLAIIVDEAEHVRNFTARRQERANDFFDALGRCAHRPKRRAPAQADSMVDLPAYWKDGPHFALFVGLTPTQDFSADDYEESCVFAHTAEDIITLGTPTPAKYRVWCEQFWERSGQHLGPRAALLQSAEVREALAERVMKAFKASPPSERVMRRWTKLAALAPATLLAGHAPNASTLADVMTEGAAWMSIVPSMPWEAPGS